MRITRTDVDDALLLVNLAMRQFNVYEMGYSYCSHTRKYDLQTIENGKRVTNDTDLTAKEVWLYFQGIILGHTVFSKGIPK